jgi:hypothetical protein
MRNGLRFPDNVVGSFATVRLSRSDGFQHVEGLAHRQT